MNGRAIAALLVTLLIVGREAWRYREQKELVQKQARIDCGGDAQCIAAVGACFEREVPWFWKTTHVTAFGACASPYVKRAQSAVSPPG